MEPKHSFVFQIAQPGIDSVIIWEGWIDRKPHLYYRALACMLLRAMGEGKRGKEPSVIFFFPALPSNRLSDLQLYL